MGTPAGEAWTAVAERAPVRMGTDVWSIEMRDRAALLARYHARLAEVR